MLAKAGLGLRFNEHMEGDGPTIFAHACKMGLEDIGSKGKESIYRSGRSTDWLKFSSTGGYGVGLPCPSLQHLQQPAPAARDGLIALWCGLRDAQPTQPSSRAELQQARLALGLHRAQRGQSSASQLATNTNPHIE